MRGSLRPACPDLRPEMRFRLVSAAIYRPYRVVSGLFPGRTGAAVFLAKGGKIYLRGA
jgi:hypothetical protein